MKITCREETRHAREKRNRFLLLARDWLFSCVIMRFPRVVFQFLMMWHKPQKLMQTEVSKDNGALFSCQGLDSHLIVACRVARRQERGDSDEVLESRTHLSLPSTLIRSNLRAFILFLPPPPLSKLSAVNPCKTISKRVYLLEQIVYL